MRGSKSSTSFDRASEHTDRRSSERGIARSSLDTFIIPGRTRLPSSKVLTPEPIDLQIVQGLLNPESFKIPRKPLYHSEKHTTTQESKTSEDLPAYEEKSYPKQNMAHDDLFFPSPPPPPPIFRLKDKANQARGAHQRSPNKNHQSGEIEDNVPLLHSRMTSRSSEYQIHSLDGRYDLSHGSQVTSATWSTISHRIFTDSSGSTYARDQAQHVKAYNRLALKYGLPRFTETTETPSNGEVTKAESINPSTSHHNWLMRKILRRSTSTHNVKVKNHTRVLPRKMSVANMSNIQERGRKDFFKDKSLEEIGRLGGLNYFVLPHEFAMDILALPTCLSASATYLVQHGRTTPGIFRVPGQLSTVNALYDYYAYQFSSADSMPGHVQQTVGSGLLPTHIAHTVHDVASLFKKLVSGMPGGLLGSLSLFKAFRSISDDFHADPKHSDLQQAKVKARLIALAISSVTSLSRISLICAVLGLAAVVGHEAQLATTDNGDDEQTSSELMGYQSLGVVFGPVLLGDLTDYLDVDITSDKDGLLMIPDSPKKRRKDKRAKAADKLQPNADVIACIDRVKVTARVMQMLISDWQGVVKQLRIINAPGNSSYSGSKGHRLRSDNSRLSMSSSQENLLFDYVRGRTLPEGFKGSTKVNKKVKISNRSPSSYRGIRASSHSGSRTWKSKTSQNSSRKVSFRDPNQEHLRLPFRQPIQDQERQTPNFQKVADTTLNPGIATAAAQELCRLEKEDDSPGNALYHDPQNLLNVIAQDHTPVRERQPERSDDDDNQSYVNQSYTSWKPQSVQWPGAAGVMDRCSDANSLPPSNTIAMMGEAVPGDGSIFPERESSLSQGHQKLIQLSHFNPVELKSQYDEHTTIPERHNSVKFLAQRFSEAQSADAQIMKQNILSNSHVHVRSLQTSDDGFSQFKDPPAQAPFPNSTPPSRGKDSMVPKPVKDRGRRRNTLSRSPSPIKKTMTAKKILQKHGSLYDILPEKREAVISSSDLLEKDDPTERDVPSTSLRHVPSHDMNIPNPPGVDVPKRVLLTKDHLTALSAESLRRGFGTQVKEEPPVAQHLHFRVSTDRLSSAEQFQYRLSLNSDPADTPRPSRTSNAATLYAEIRRLQRAYDGKCEEVAAMGRTLEALREWREGGGSEGFGGSIEDNGQQQHGQGIARGKSSLVRMGSTAGGLSESVREMRREANMWKNRAIWAERRLLGAGLQNEKHVRQEENGLDEWESVSEDDKHGGEE